MSKKKVEVNNKNNSKRVVFGNIAIKLLAVSLIAYASSCLYLRTYNNKLTMDIQDAQRKISKLKLENAELDSAIRSIISKQQVVEAVTEGGFQQNLNNVYSVVNDIY